MTNKIAQQPLIVAENDGFKDDLLKRDKFGENLTNLVQNIDEPLTISINGQWGDGKTTFVKMWQGQLNEAGLHSIYFDAFANDYSDDAFISIVSTINGYADKHILDKEFKESFQNEAVSVAKNIVKASVKIGVKWLTLGAIDGEEALKDIEGDLAKLSSEITENYLREKLFNHQEKEKTIIDFQKSLKNLPQRLKSICNDSQALNDNPLIIIIDELDRCKPTFAIEILEKIKHLFAVENIVFVLAMNREQLEESIKSIYGANFDAHTYLQKFLTVETALPITKIQYETGYEIYAEQLAQFHKIDFIESGDIKMIALLSWSFNLSLRQVDNVFTQLNLFNKVHVGNIVLKQVLYLIVVIKIKNKKLFKCLLNKSQDELLEELEKIKGFKQGNAIVNKLSWLINGKGDFDYQEEYELTQKIRASGLEPFQLIPFYIEKLDVFV